MGIICQGLISTTTTLSFPGKNPTSSMRAMFGFHLQRDIQLIENVQKFGLGICSKQWDLEHLSNFNVPNLQSHPLQHKLCTTFKIVHNLISLPPSVFVPRPSRYQSNVFSEPFAHTNCFLHSFVPSTIPSWNSLPPNVTNAPTLPAFKAFYMHNSL